jgi:hypothetical protein
MTKRQQAATLNDRGLQYQERGKLKRATELFREASAIDPTWPVPLYNLGLLFKNKGKWKESIKYNQQATAVDPKHEAAWWNLGIAATALHRWQLARAAWRGFGIDVPDGKGAIDFPCGFCPIRINPDTNAEIVWADRIDPARAMLASIPLPESNHRWKDVVLNDGAPTGYRRLRGKDVPVFNELELLEHSPFVTYVADVKMPAGNESMEKLTEIATEQGGCAEDWSTSIRFLCKQCSEGRIHATHDTDAARPRGVHLVGLAARDRNHASDMLFAWESTTPGVKVKSLDNGAAGGRSKPSR